MANGKEFIPVIFITIIVCVSVSVLTFVDVGTRDMIEENERLEIQKNLEVLFEELEGNATYEDIADIGVYRVFDNSTNETFGYAFIVKGQGYGGEIKLLVGIEDELDNIQLRGMRVVSHGETPGLGARISESWFQEQFSGLKVGELNLTQNGGKVDAITGATISSKAVTNAVRDATLDKVADIKELEVGA